MTYAELSEAQARRSRQFAEAQTDAMSAYCDAERDLKDLQAENAKLRELLVDAWGYINHTADASWTHTRRKEARDSLSDRIRELEVEK